VTAVDAEQPVSKKAKKMVIKPVLQLTTSSDGNIFFSNYLAYVFCNFFFISNVKNVF